MDPREGRPLLGRGSSNGSPKITRTTTNKSIEENYDPKEENIKLYKKTQKSRALLYTTEQRNLSP